MESTISVGTIIMLAATLFMFGAVCAVAVWLVKMALCHKWKNVERNVKFCLLCMFLGVANVAVYWIAVFMGKAPGETVACTGMVEMIAPVLGYYVYQAKLKDSRNKYGIDENGVPYGISQKTEDETDGKAAG